MTTHRFPRKAPTRSFSSGPSTDRRVAALSRPTRPTGKRFTRKELRVIRTYRTPASVQQYINTLHYNDDRPETVRSFRGVIRSGKAHCLEAAMTAAVILEQYGYPALVLDMESSSSPDHVVYIYRSKRTGLWGAIGKSRDPGLEGRRPVFSSVRALVYSYHDPFIDHRARIVAYGVANLHDIAGYDWRFSEGNVWKVERYFCHISHKPLRSSEARIEFWRKRFLEFKQKYPDRVPTHFENRGTWAPGYSRARR